MNRLVYTSWMSFLVMTAVPHALAAANDPSWYIGVTGFYANIDDADVTEGALKYKVGFDDGYGVGGSVGYLIPPSGSAFDNIRLEGEFSYRTHGSKNVRIAGFTVPYSADVKTYSYMGNLYYDFRNSSRLNPYVGAGAGGSTLKVKDIDSSGSATSFAYQFMGGVAYSFEAFPSVEWHIGYRYLATEGLSFKATSADRVKVDYNSHNGEVGAKLLF